MSRASLYQVAVFSFAAGIVVYDIAQAWKDKGHEEAMEKQVAECRADPRYGYATITESGKIECRALMPRFVADWPIKKR